MIEISEKEISEKEKRGNSDMNNNTNYNMNPPETSSPEGRRFAEKIGAAMYTVHKSVAQDMYAAFQALADMGYRAVEFYGEPEFDIETVRKSLEQSGLILSGWHTEWRNLQEDRFAQTVEYLHQVNCPLAVVPCLGGKWRIAHGPEEECREIWLRYIEQMNLLSEKLGSEGIRMGYHNHDHEFRLAYDGKQVFDLLFDGLSEKIIMEFDSGNCIEGGADPLRVLEKYRDREKILHLKPYSHTNGFNTVLHAPDDANDWETILHPPGKEYLWMLIESENEVLPELDNAKQCMEGFREIAK